MSRSLLCALPLVVLLLSGCPSVPVEPDSIENAPIPNLEMVRSPYSLDAIDSISISEDGNIFLGWGEYGGVVLFHQNDYSIIEKHYERDMSNLKYERDIGTATGYIQNAGFFDNNTWYFGVIPKTEDGHIGEHIDIHIRSIQPSREIAKYSFSWSISNDKLIVNKNHFVIIRDSVSDDTVTLVDWRTGAHHSFTIPPYQYVSGFMWLRRFPNPLTLTSHSRILAKDIYKNGYYWFFFDPFTQQKHLLDPSTEQKGKLEKDTIISPSERYVIDLGESRCKLRKFPAHETVSLKDQEIIGYCSDKFSKIEEWEKPITFFSSDEKFFVFAFRHNVRVYRMEPFQLEFEGNTSDYIRDAKLSENGLLATGDKKGFLRVWDIRTKRAVGQYSFFDPSDEEKRFFFPSLIFHPNGERLFVIAYRYLYDFQLPKRGAE